MLKKILILFVVFLVGLLLCTGCSAPITSGKITNKKFVAKHTIHNPAIKVGDITIPASTTDVPDKWYITFSSETEDGTIRNRKIQVTEGFYNESKYGDLFNLEWHKHK